MPRWDVVEAYQRLAKELGEDAAGGDVAAVPALVLAVVAQEVPAVGERAPREHG